MIDSCVPPSQIAEVLMFFCFVPLIKKKPCYLIKLKALVCVETDIFSNIIQVDPSLLWFSAPAETLSSTLILEPSTPPQLTPDPLATFSSPPVQVEPDAHVTTSTFLTQQGSPTTVSPQPTTTERPLSSAAGRGSTAPTQREVPAQLNVGDEGERRRRYQTSCSPGFTLVTLSFIWRRQTTPRLEFPSGPPAGCSAVSVHCHHRCRLHHPLLQIPPAHQQSRVPPAAGFAHGKIIILKKTSWIGRELEVQA